jgi:Fe-S-cluster containining protein
MSVTSEPRNQYDCTKCPAYCCSIYGRVQVSDRDLKRLARHLGLGVKETEARYTKWNDDERVLRRRKDDLLGESCRFLHPETRGCTIYEGRPQVCRDYPGRRRCTYYDVLMFEQETQEDTDVLPLVQITFKKR